mmetsp:Transcript_18164/g.29486  ORF Transcript_18164/g.29486 Transcript_18164/m.29486 type:complete len:292 (-) Transcript_18164:2491-3366(-)|eukprot:CAMPEP_0203749026 /NCGR_PEP_ID=MMETSP0098-20131031/3728_1 /ASSEMBLY_ACC=CAM_ASM_000208 /TAXON_ID=96639 /ORGANISM=" , Strain NY0313808BC1" /LENGTH=291 /DNA_ID=CAMNT_0050637955 /DNA_START=154 /DNA_END=1029 /DNA_ORIENTATION=+
MAVGKVPSADRDASTSKGPRFQVLNPGCGAGLLVRFKKGETIQAESDALVTMSQHVRLASKMEGGIFSSLMRMLLVNESFFLQTLTATAGDDNDVLLAATKPGDIVLLDTTDKPFNVVRGAFLASDSSVHTACQTQMNLKKMAFGSGLFILTVSGNGTTAINSCGSMFEYNLGPGEVRSVDNGHLVAWSSDMEYSIGLATQSLFSSITSGEGLMCHFRGPGTLYLQSHKPEPEKRQEPSLEARKKCTQVFCVLFLFVLFFMFSVAMILMNSDEDRFGFPEDRRINYRDPRY